MILTNFAGQNWLITPAALAFGEPPPASIHDQKWLLVLTGVVTANLQGNSTSAWLNANLSFLPDLAGAGGSGPLNWAIGRYGIPKPKRQDYTIGFALDEWAPFVSLSGIYDRAQSIDAGFALNVWRPNHFATGIDALSNTTVSNIFTGVNVDARVRDTDAKILSLGYNITLRGRIVFPKVAIPLFQSNFASTVAGQPPAAVQAVGTANFHGPVVVGPPIVPDTGNWLQAGPVTTKDAMFTGVFEDVLGPGVYTFSATMFLSSRTTEARIAFVSGVDEEFLLLYFAPDDRVHIEFVETTDCIFPRGQPFSVQVTLAVTTASAAVQIAVGEIVVSYDLPRSPVAIAAVTFWGRTGDPFDVTDVLVTFTPP